MKKINSLLLYLVLAIAFFIANNANCQASDNYNHYWVPDYKSVKLIEGNSTHHLLKYECSKCDDIKWEEEEHRLGPNFSFGLYDDESHYYYNKRCYSCDYIESKLEKHYYEYLKREFINNYDGTHTLKQKCTRCDYVHEETISHEAYFWNKYKSDEDSEYAHSYENWAKYYDEEQHVYSYTCDCQAEISIYTNHLRDGWSYGGWNSTKYDQTYHNTTYKRQCKICDGYFYETEKKEHNYWYPTVTTKTVKDTIYTTEVYECNRCGHKKTVNTSQKMDAKLKAASITLEQGEKKNAVLYYIADTITWSSSNKNIATVTSTGTIQGIKPGKCSVYTYYRGKKYTISVTVNQGTPKMDCFLTKYKNKKTFTVYLKNMGSYPITVYKSNAYSYCARCAFTFCGKCKNRSLSMKKNIVIKPGQRKNFTFTIKGQKIKKCTSRTDDFVVGFKLQYCGKKYNVKAYSSGSKVYINNKWKCMYDTNSDPFTYIKVVDCGHGASRTIPWRRY